MKPGFFNSESPSTLLLQKACFLTLHTFISLTHTVMNASQSLPEFHMGCIFIPQLPSDSQPTPRLFRPDV